MATCRSPRPCPPGPSELAALATAFNRMADHLRELRHSDLGPPARRAAARRSGHRFTLRPGHRHRRREPRHTHESRGGRGLRPDPPVARTADRPAWRRTRHRARGLGRDPLRPEHGGGRDRRGGARRATGAAREYRIRTTPMRDDEGHVLGSVTLLEDITHLREIDRVKSEFIAVASHELRTPLTSALMGIHLLLEPTHRAADRRAASSSPSCAATTAIASISWRGSCSISAAWMPIRSLSHRPPFRFGPCSSDAVEKLRTVVEAKGSRCADADRRLRDGGPGRSQPRFERVIANLVTNAVRATEAGGTITVQAVVDDDHAVIAVRDTGRGIPAEHLPRLFDDVQPGAGRNIRRRRPGPLDRASGSSRPTAAASGCSRRQVTAASSASRCQSRRNEPARREATRRCRSMS